MDRQQAKLLDLDAVSYHTTLDDRMRQETSTFVWAHITQGEPRFAPRPIEATQPEHIRDRGADPQAWLRRRANTWANSPTPR